MVPSLCHCQTECARDGDDSSRAMARDSRSHSRLEALRKRVAGTVTGSSFSAKTRSLSPHSPKSDSGPTESRVDMRDMERLNSPKPVAGPPGGWERDDVDATLTFTSSPQAQAMPV